MENGNNDLVSIESQTEHSITNGETESKICTLTVIVFRLNRK